MKSIKNQTSSETTQIDQEQPNEVCQEPDKFRNNLVDQNNPDEGRQEPDKFGNNSD
jgi:hypothetical protein